VGQVGGNPQQVQGRVAAGGEQAKQGGIGDQSPAQGAAVLALAHHDAVAAAAEHGGQQLDTGLAADVTPQLAAEAGGADRVAAVVRQVRVLGAACKAMVLAVRGRVGVTVAENRIGGEPLSGVAIQRRGAKQGFVSRLVHEHRQAQLPPAEQEHGGDHGQGIGPASDDGEQEPYQQPVEQYHRAARQVAAPGEVANLVACQVITCLHGGSGPPRQNVT
jgi:hypothetical protein